jgi:energy-coupling factor transporter ATP-binding protein EcfA2
MNRPKILLADEPTGSLDEQTSGSVFDLLLEIVATEGVTLVMATHDRRISRALRPACWKCTMGGFMSQSDALMQSYLRRALRGRSPAPHGTPCSGLSLPMPSVC